MSEWRLICPVQRLPVDRGVAALIDTKQVAVFRTADDSLHAVSNQDPFSGAMVLSRGIVGSRGERRTVTSPLHKQVFDLETGQCLDDPSVSLLVHDVRVQHGIVEVALRARPPAMRPDTVRCRPRRAKAPPVTVGRPWAVWGPSQPAGGPGESSAVRMQDRTRCGSCSRPTRRHARSRRCRG